MPEMNLLEACDHVEESRCPSTNRAENDDEQPASLAQAPDVQIPQLVPQLYTRRQTSILYHVQGQENKSGFGAYHLQSLQGPEHHKHNRPLKFE